MQRKFLFLFLILGAMAGANVIATTWALRLFNREVATPQVTIQQTLVELHAIKRSAETIGELVVDSGATESLAVTRRFGNEGAPKEAESSGDAVHESRGGTPLLTMEQTSAEMLAQLASAETSLQRLQQVDTLVIRMGSTTLGNLRDRVYFADREARQWLGTGGKGSAEALGTALFAIHELIERIEGRILRVAGAETEFQSTIQGWIGWVLGGSIAAMILTIGLASSLVGRWIIKPVAELRTAAAAYAQGRFDHRAPVAGKDELAQLGHEFNQMAGTITAMQEERVSRERIAAMGEMVRRLVHNLRNPLAGVRGLAQISISDLRDTPPPVETVRGHLDRMVKTVDAFERWLKELLDTTRPLDLRIEDVRLGEWMDSVVEPLRAVAQASGVELVIERAGAPESVAMDARQLGQAVVGIVNNAIQASPRGGRVRIEARAMDGEPKWEVGIWDQGSGIPPELRERVFLPNFTTKSDGTGIGLAVAKQVVEQHGGRIWIDGESGDGSGEASGGNGAIVRIRLPLRVLPSMAPGGHRGGSERALIGQNPDHRR